MLSGLLCYVLSSGNWTGGWLDDHAWPWITPTLAVLLPVLVGLHLGVSLLLLLSARGPTGVHDALPGYIPYARGFFPSAKPNYRK